jgi:REP element-mobilizing transposase RayT
MEAWNGWYHVNGNTYGTWLPGDPRGWRSKRHRRHVEGDYKSPPPSGSGDGLHEHARGLLRQQPVYLTPAQRETAGRALVDMLLDQQVEVIILSLGVIHFHLLARFPDRQVRPRVARAKRHSMYLCREHGCTGRLWTRDVKVTPIADRRHQVRVFRYVGNHQRQGAWLWTFRDGIYWPTTIRRR